MLKTTVRRSSLMPILLGTFIVMLLYAPVAHAEESLANPTSAMPVSSVVQEDASFDVCPDSSTGGSDGKASSESANRAFAASAALASSSVTPIDESEIDTKGQQGGLSEDATGTDVASMRLEAIPQQESQLDQFSASEDVVVANEQAEQSEQASLSAQASTGYDASHVNMYRLYNPNSGEHFYTSDIDEATSVASVGWQWEGVGWVAPVKSSSPVFRLYNPNAGDHHYTLNEAERDWLVGLGWNFEGIGWYSDTADAIAVFRQYNPNAVAGAHNFTTDASEDINLGDVGWQREGTAWYATNGPVVAISGRWLVTAAWGSLERYWIDSTGSIARSRLINANEGAGYDAYATDSGAVVRGKYDTGVGYVYVADEEGRLAATADGNDGWIVTAAYDGVNQRYFYVASQHAMHSGFFIIDDFRYFGLADEGYVVRGWANWGKHVLLADNDGHLATGTGWLSTDLYDGHETRRYYLEYVWSDFSGAKTGLFSVDDSYYFGVSDGGYVVDDLGTTWVNGWWHTMQNGVLTEVAPEMHQRVNRFVELMKAMAADDSHGYDQTYRWGEYGDYDCSSLVVHCLKEVGFNTGSASYTGNMRQNLVEHGWEWRDTIGEAELQPGVVLLNMRRHTAAMISTTQLAQASINENGSISGGQPGDQTGKEVLVRNYYDYPWDGVLIPTPWCDLA